MHFFQQLSHHVGNLYVILHAHFKFQLLYFSIQFLANTWLGSIKWLKYLDPWHPCGDLDGVTSSTFGLAQPYPCRHLMSVTCEPVDSSWFILILPPSSCSSPSAIWIWTWVWAQLLHFQFGSQLISLAKQHKMAQLVGSLQPCGKPGRIFWPLASAWSSTRHCSHLRNEPANGRCLSLFI